MQVAANALAKERQPQFNAPRALPATFADPRRVVRNALVLAANNCLSLEQMRRYQSEIAQRDEYRKQAIIENRVVLYDDALSLTPKQRTDIRRALERHWEERLVRGDRRAARGQSVCPLHSYQLPLPPHR